MSKENSEYETFLTDSAQRGVAIIEGAVIILVLMIMVAWTAELGAVMVASNRVVNATREAARVGTSAPDLVANDPRIADIANVRLAQYSNIVVANTAPTAAPVINNSDGFECNREFTVNVSADYDFLLWRLVGVNSRTVQHRLTMRYNRQALCY